MERVGWNCVRVEETPRSPEMEFTKMKLAATPEITLMGAQWKNTKIGLRKIPPPTPVRPDRKPNPAPVNNKKGMDGFFTSSLNPFLAWEINRQAENNKMKPTKGL